MPVYSVEVIKRAESADGGVFWANRYEVDATDNTATVGGGVANAFRVFEQGFLLDCFFVDRVVVSTYARDGEPYNPATVYVLPVNQRGQRTEPVVGITDALPLTNTLHIRKLVSSGRLGHILLRGYWREGDIQSDRNSGTVTAGDYVGLQSAVNTAYGVLTSSLSAANAALVLASGSGLLGPDQRPVTGLNVAGLSYKGFRARRKTRLVGNSITTLGEILSDGGVTLGEIPALIEAVGPLVRALGGPQLPPLLP